MDSFEFRFALRPRGKTPVAIGKPRSCNRKGSAYVRCVFPAQALAVLWHITVLRSFGHAGSDQVHQSLLE